MSEDVFIKIFYPLFLDVICLPFFKYKDLQTFNFLYLYKKF